MAAMDAERFNQVDNLLQSALLVPSDQREGFLRQACAGDAELEQEVRSLLTSHRNAGGFLESPAIKVAAQTIAITEARTGGESLLGQTISHYRVLRKLGSGGMGAVYEAEDLRLGRHVALKVLLESQATKSKALQRFEHEARAISSLNHPNICTLYEVEEYDGKPVIVMELLEGETLKERMKAGRVPLAQVVRWGTEVADALEAAHAAGLVHRDIKPANVFVTRRGSAKVLDFGLAKLSQTAPGGAVANFDEESLTSMGVIPGTTAYMSPEQVRGDELDGRTDVFSLGVVLYEVATRQRAFAEKNVALTMDAVLHKRPDSPVTINPELPPELDAIINKAMEKECELRYQSAADLRADLQQLKRDADSGVMKTIGSRPVSGLEAPVVRRVKLWHVAAPLAVVIALLAGWLYYRPHQTQPLTDKDTVVLADFTNTTGDTVFDDTLRQGLAAQLEQSPFLNLLSDDRIAQTLSLMAQPKDARLTHAVAREVCQRAAGAATIEGSIASLGSQYVLGVKAINCRNGDSLADEQITANNKERVLKALGDAATKLRQRLGESLGSMQKYDTPPEDVTTSSLDALNAYSLGLKARHEKGDFASIPFFRQAVQLDPQFAMAYLRLGIEYWNIGEANQATQNCAAAFALRDRVSVRERFHIDANYYDSVTRDLQKAEENFQLWAQTYPQDPVPLDQLGNDYLFTGQYPQALEALLEEKKLAKGGYFNYTNLVYAYLGLNRFHDARLVIEEAQARRLEPAPGYRALYTIDFLEGNLPGMQEDIGWAAGKAFWEASSLDQQSDTAAYWGHLTQAWALSQKAVAAARRENENEIAARFMVYAALREAEFGNSAQALERANSALTLLPSRDVKTISALALARAGSAKRARTLADELAKDNPSDTLLNLYWVPTIRASAELDENRPRQAIDILQAAAPYELGQPPLMGPATLYPVYVRGEAYFRLGQAVQAASEFQKLLDHPGCVMNFPLGALAHLQLGRAYAMQGGTVKARAAYQDFFTLWKDADPDSPVLKQAKAEYAKLH